MSDDICVNIYSGLSRMTGSMINRIFEPSSGEAQDSGLGALLLDLWFYWPLY